MKRLILVAIIALAMGGCTTLNTPEGPRTYVWAKRGINVQLTHTFTNVARVYQAGVGSEFTVVGAKPRNIPLGAVFGDQYITLTVQSMNDKGEVVRTCVGVFPIDRYSTTSRPWLISKGGRSSVSGGGYTECVR